MIIILKSNNEINPTITASGRKSPAPNTRSRKSTNKPKENTPCFRVIPLGGLGEIGKNFTVFECEDDIIIVDCGIKFPDEDMYGIDFVIPDFSYLDDKKDRIRGLFLTHGHEDHIGAISYFIKRFGSIPIYGTKLTIGLLGNKLVEHNLDKKANLNVVHYRSTITVKGFTVEFVVTNHSIPDSAALFIKCKGGNIFHTGDFKIDLTPVDNQKIDLARMGAIGTEGVDLLIADSTNAERKGYTPSESTVGETFLNLFAQAEKKRIIVATFATNVHRLQQVFDAAKHYKRKVVVSGRSMINVLNVAKELKYLKFKDSILLDINSVNSVPPEQMVVLTTGSQGEPMSALSRMASGEHRQLKISKDDFVIISASPIPGNEKTVAYVISNLIKLGADVVYHGARDVHVSGHGCQEDIKIIFALTKPKYFMPCHGEYKMLDANSKTAQKMGVDKKNVFVMQNGDILQVSQNGAEIADHVTVGLTLVDGSGIGDVGNIVLKDRKKLSEGGLFVVSATVDKNSIICGPEILSRGFIYMRESSGLLNEAKDICYDTILSCLSQGNDIGAIKQAIKQTLDNFLYDKTLRRPIVMPIIMNAKSRGNE